MPCQVLSYDKDALGFRSPFIQQQIISTACVKAVEFRPSRIRGPAHAFSSVTNGWLGDIMGPESQIALGINAVKLERALTVPRFRRENPSIHILVAKNGDLKRGNLLDMDTQNVQFESKLRKQTFPVDRLAWVVNISQPEPEPNETSTIAANPRAQVRADLADGSILSFEVLDSRDGKLIGHSTLYGDMAIPVDSIRHLHIGDFDQAQRKSLFNDWVVRPAREPEFGDGEGT